MTRTIKEVFIAYESGHVDEACEQAGRGATIVCLNFLVGRMLDKKKIPYIPLPDIIEADSKEEVAWWELSHRIASEWYRLPAMKFFEYEGIAIAEPPDPTVHTYLSRLFYYVWVYDALAKKYPDAFFHIPAPEITRAATSYGLAHFIAWSSVDGARMARLRSTARGTRPAAGTLFIRPTWKDVLTRAYNVFMRLLPPRALTIYASAYWMHGESVIDRMDDTALVLLESTRRNDMSWSFLFKRRVRFRHSQDPVSIAEERIARKIAEAFREPWGSARKVVAAYLANIRKEYDWSPVLEMCDELIAYAPRVIADIRTLRRAMKEEKPDVVLDMASVGGPQHYFFLLARVAQACGIPTLELQHATATIDPRSVFSRIETDYLATYGVDVNRWHEKIGQPSEKLIPVGSPRFDQYVNEHDKGVAEGKRLFRTFGLDVTRPVLFAVVPYSDVYVGTLDSYQSATFFETIRLVQESVPGLQVVFKFRSRNHIGGMRDYVAELFPTDTAIASDEDIFALLCASDATVCNNSTVLYQAVLAKKPLILYPWKAHDHYHAQVYASDIPLFYYGA
ncbi:MAG: Type 12 methyltransferase, partial [Parcubacteria group bacterium Gr01-1014_49]